MTLEESEKGCVSPKRRIVKSGPSYTHHPSNRMKKPMFVILECGHDDTVGKIDVNQGWTYCFDCYYNKPKHHECVMCNDDKEWVPAKVGTIPATIKITKGDLSPGSRIEWIEIENGKPQTGIIDRVDPLLIERM